MIYTGKILDPEGRPIPGATLVFLTDTGEPVATIPVNNGAWSLDTDFDGDLFSPGFVAKFSAPGYGYYSLSATSLDQNFNVTLQKTANTNGIVLAALAIAVLPAMVSKKKTVGAVTSDQVKTAAYIGGGILVVVLLKQLLETLGIWKSKDTKDLDTATVDPTSFWNPSYWMNHQNQVTMSYDTAKKMVDEIQGFFSPLNDDEAGAIGLFKRMKSKADLSFLAAAWDAEYGGDLLTYLRGGWWPLDRLSDESVNTINNFIAKLP